MRSLHWLLAAALAGGASLFVTGQTVTAADTGANAAAAAPSQPLGLPAGFDMKDVKATSEVRTGLAKLADRSVTKGDWNKFLAELATGDKDRLREFKGADQAKLDQQIDRIRTAWKEKYGKDFDSIKDSTFNDTFVIVQGEVADPATALRTWPLPCCSTEAVTAGEHVQAANDKELKKAESQAKLEKGRNVAVVRFPAAFGMPEMTVSMLHELPMFYRVDIPNDRTGEQVYNDLLTHLTYLADHSAQWPSDVNEGYRAVAYHAIAAVYGVQTPKT